MDIRNKINRWSKMTYGEMLESRINNNRYRQGLEAEMAHKVLANQKLLDKTMDGNSTSGLLNMEKEVGKFQYVKVFNTIIKMSDWSPMDMVYGTCFLAMRDPNVRIKAQQWGMSEEELITKMCGRALRALPSYLREHDLKAQLSQRFPNAEFVQNQALDTILHADLMMRYRGNDYYFWSFVDTPRSVENFKDKFFGHRQGNIPDGYHITCPFSLDCGDDVYGWKLYEGLSIGAIARVVDYPAHANYSNLENDVRSSNMFFKTPKLIEKDECREHEIELEEMCIGDR